MAAVQRALTEYGYGQLKPTGAIGPDTLAAIQKFERERKLPVTGQISERMVRELPADGELQSRVECRVDGTAPPSGHQLGRFRCGVPAIRPRLHCISITTLPCSICA